MLEKTHYLNGQRIWILDNNILNFYYKNGKLKAEGKYLNDEMQGEWFFYDQVEQLIQIGNFKDNLKHGIWLRFDKNGNEEYKEEFENGKIVKK